MHCALRISRVVPAPIRVSPILKFPPGGLYGIFYQGQGYESHLCVPCERFPSLLPSPESATAAYQTALAHCPQMYALIRSASTASLTLHCWMRLDKHSVTKLRKSSTQI